MTGELRERKTHITVRNRLKFPPALPLARHPHKGQASAVGPLPLLLHGSAARRRFKASSVCSAARCLTAWSCRGETPTPLEREGWLESQLPERYQAINATRSSQLRLRLVGCQSGRKIGGVIHVRQTPLISLSAQKINTSSSGLVFRGDLILVRRSRLRAD